MAAPEITLTHLAGPPDRPVVLVGPSIGTRVQRLWAATAAHLPDHRVIGWDLPGHGRSAPTEEPFSTAELAAQVLRAVDCAVGGSNRLHYAGDSFGGCVGLQLALDHPARFATMIILCSGAKIATADVWRERIALVHREGMRPIQQASPQRWFGTRIAEQPTQDSRAVVEEVADVDAFSYSLACAALAEFDVRDRLSDIQIPLLAVAGADDLVTTPDQHRGLAAQTPGARVEVLDGVAHLAPLEDPLTTAVLLEKHFREGT